MIQRIFIPGDKWLYYKIYTGYKTADMLITDVIGPLSCELISAGLVSRWFFIRFSDPNHHIRWRIELSDQNHLGRVINYVHQTIKPFVISKQVFKVQTDTYKREIERYGIHTIEQSEALFWHESVMVSKMLALIEGDEGERLRWLFVMKAINQLLDDFSFNIQQKFELLKILDKSFSKEFNKVEPLRTQINDKYREEKESIRGFITGSYNNQHQYLSLYGLIGDKTKSSIEVVNEICYLTKKQQDVINGLLMSYIHMLMNRLFQARQRLYELVIYDFLFKYYRSELSNEKFEKSNV